MTTAIVLGSIPTYLAVGLLTARYVGWQAARESVCENPGESCPDAQQYARERQKCGSYHGTSFCRCWKFKHTCADTPTAENHLADAATGFAFWPIILVYWAFTAFVCRPPRDVKTARMEKELLDTDWTK